MRQIYRLYLYKYKDIKIKRKLFIPAPYSEILLYLHDYQPVNDWCAVLIFINGRNPTSLPTNHRSRVSMRISGVSDVWMVETRHIPQSNLAIIIQQASLFV